MNLKQLYYFKRLAELQHYTKAASELYISQPSLSFAISSLENELGTTLFQKQGRNVVLTKYGKDFYTHVELALSELDTGITNLKQNTNIQTGKIDIGVIQTLLGDYMPDIIQEYMKQYPQASINLYQGATKNVIEGIKEGTYDIGFCSMVENEDDLDFIPMLSQEFVIITKKDHEFAKYKKISLTEIDKYPIITYRDNIPIGKSVRCLLSENQVSPKIIQTFDDETTIGGMVSKDFGIALVANTPLLKQFNITIIPIDAKTHSRIVYLTYHKHHFHTEAVENFIKFMKEKELIG